MNHSSFSEITTNHPLTNYCRNATNKEGDSFVGIKSENIDGTHTISINFPMGYNISDNEEIVRNEIIQLVTVLQMYNDEDSKISEIRPEQILKTIQFPVQSYFTVLHDYLNNDYYQVQEKQYQVGLSGPINWSQTIKKQTPIIQSSGFVYTEYMVKHFTETDKDMITEINKYCVYQSSLRLGWLYKIPLARKPQVIREIALYLKYLNSIIQRTHKDRDKLLFQAMINILKFENSLDDPDTFYFGTNNFEYIWEKLIEQTFGNLRKEDYFPRTKWQLNIGRNRTNSAIEPDTVMRCDDNIFVLDAKYYKYGITQLPKDLPNSSSINKQISYGEYIATHSKFRKEVADGSVYNAFLMPYNSMDEPYNGLSGNIFSVGEAVAEWKLSDETYERVQGILVDVKELIGNTIKPNNRKIIELSNSIVESLHKNKKRETE